MCMDPRQIHVVSQRMFDDYQALCRDLVFPQEYAWTLHCEQRICDAEASGRPEEAKHWSAMRAFGQSISCNVYPILEVAGEPVYIISGHAEPLPRNPYVHDLNMTIDHEGCYRKDFV